MNDIEDRLRTAFATQAATVRPTPDAATENNRRVRRSVRRRYALTAGAVASVLAVAIPVALTTGGRAHGAAPTLASSGPLVKAQGNPQDLTGPTGPFQLPAAKAHVPATPMALAPDGSFLARLGNQVWLLGPSRGTDVRKPPVPSPKRLDAPDTYQHAEHEIGSPVASAMSPQARVLINSRGELMCVDARGKRVTSYAPASRTRGVWTDGRNAVVSAPTGTLQVSGGCPDPAAVRNRTEGFNNTLRLNKATPLALRGSLLVTAVPSSGRVVEYTLPYTPPRIAVVDQLPKGAGPIRLTEDGSPLLYTAANTTTSVWVNGRSLLTLGLNHHEAGPSLRLPKALDVGEDGQLTVGDHVIAYTATDSGGRVGSFVYDLRTGRQIIWPGRVFAAGGWLLWQNGDGMQLGQVR
ncbi:hypothetical protein AB0L06_34340 [Spirillospora sp. NPDC052269]